ncbi:NYN domain-containing protein [Pontibacter sp. G13]|uniref:NYN domain-containing protein n=1 Tax=Pontibacter sp. G13 TaxID=3074898 RepID=UPI00288A0E0D|nr:NYN domain-containing protein [Pontibacter sp. G13]WNJ17929.1 NYN domain-containing protein [Pontibacter sp. G13]
MLSTDPRNGLIRIGVFYDGNYFFHVSNYYNYVHDQRSRLSISGIHDFIKHHVAEHENTEPHLCQIVDAHYFRGRLSAKEASQRGNQLYYDRVFDDILMSEGVVTHYFPLRFVGGRKEERGVNVWLALEAFELAIHKNFDVVVLIASDGDYVPLVRKLSTLGTRVMVLGWNFEFTNDQGRLVTTKTSQDLLKESTYPVAMHDMIDDPINRHEDLIQGLFVPPSIHQSNRDEEEEDDQYYDDDDENDEDGYYEEEDLDGQEQNSTVLSIHNGFGFISYPNNNLFFYHEDVVGEDFNELAPGDPVTFFVTKNDEGKNIAKNIRRGVK